MWIKEIRCPDTGESIIGVKEFAKNVGRSGTWVSERIRFREPIKGRLYEYTGRIFKKDRQTGEVMLIEE